MRLWRSVRKPAVSAMEVAATDIARRRARSSMSAGRTLIVFASRRARWRGEALIDFTHLHRTGAHSQPKFFSSRCAIVDAADAAATHAPTRPTERDVKLTIMSNVVADLLPLSAVAILSFIAWLDSSPRS